MEKTEAAEQEPTVGFTMTVVIEGRKLSAVRFNAVGAEQAILHDVGVGAANLAAYIIQKAKQYGSAIPAEETPEARA